MSIFFMSEGTGSVRGSAEPMETEPTPVEVPEEVSKKDDFTNLEESVASSSPEQVEIKKPAAKIDFQEPENEQEKLTEALEQFYEKIQDLKRTIEQEMEITGEDSLREVKSKVKEQILDWEINEYLSDSEHIDEAIEIAFKSVSFEEMQSSLANDEQYKGLKEYLLKK